MRKAVRRVEYMDPLTEGVAARLIFALRLSDLDKDTGEIAPAPPIARTIPIVFTIAGRTHDNATWAIKYRLTLDNRDFFEYYDSDFTIQTIRHSANSFRIDSYGDNPNYQKLNGFTYFSRNPQGIDRVSSFLNCHSSGLVLWEWANANADHVDISINRDQFYLFDLYLTSDNASHFGINGIHSNTMFKKTDLVLFDSAMKFPVIPGKVNFHCEIENMPIITESKSLSVDIGSVWLALGSSDNETLGVQELSRQFFDNQTGEILNLNNGSIDIPQVSFRPFFYIKGNLKNEVDNSNLIESNIQTITNIVNIYNPTPITLDTHIVCSNTIKHRVDDLLGDTRKAPVLYTNSCTDSSGIFISFWAHYNTIYNGHMKESRIFTLDQRSSDPTKQFFYSLEFSVNSMLVYGNPSIIESQRLIRLNWDFLFRLQKGWSHFVLYIDANNDFASLSVNGESILLRVDPVQVFYPPESTTTYDTVASFPFMGVLTAELLYPLIYFKSTMDAYNLPWENTVFMANNFCDALKRPIYPGIDGTSVLSVPGATVRPDFYCDGTNGLGVFANAAQNTLCMSTAYNDSPFAREFGNSLSMPIYTEPENVIRTDLLPPLTLVEQAAAKERMEVMKAQEAQRNEVRRAESQMQNKAQNRILTPDSSSSSLEINVSSSSGFRSRIICP
jgi:hypothetical protein